jgi:hypothetical protein
MLRVIGNLFILVCIQSSICYAQETKVKVSAYDGIVILGYVDNGGFSNFTAPNINATYRNSKFILGMLPSLRFKEDKRMPKNSFVPQILELASHTVTNSLLFKYHFRTMQKQQHKMVIGKLALV